jgi:tetratricopeptide (TPR) repeat protein
MRVAIASLISMISVSAVSLCAQPSQPTDFDGWKNRGVEQFRAAKYQEAADAFQHAVDLRPDDASVHQLLATAFEQLYVPGGLQPENLAIGGRTESEFKRAFELDPSNSHPLESLTSLSYKQHKMQEAREWDSRFLAVNPRNKRAHYWAALLTWEAFNPDLVAARSSANMKPEDPGPLPSTPAKVDLLAKDGPAVDEAIAHLRRALELDPQYDQAMTYLERLIRGRADLRDTPEQYKRDAGEADTWAQRAVETKKLKSSVPPPPERVRIGGNVQLANLVRKVNPVCPPRVRASDQVQLEVIIAKNGEIQDISVIGGHPSLVPSALDAVKQWVYKPTKLNNIPVEVITRIDVNFTCGGR